MKTSAVARASATGGVRVHRVTTKDSTIRNVLEPRLTGETEDRTWSPQSTQKIISRSI